MRPPNRDPRITLSLPEWLLPLAERPPMHGDRERMAFVIELSRESARRGGGPFGAAVFERESGVLVGVGVNSVVRLRSSVMHAEVLAILFAQRAAGSYSLRAPGLPAHELVASCEPCAMCLGAVLWSGVDRLVCGAAREDAERIGFDEGPVFPQSYRYLESRGVQIVRDVLREEARAVLDLYAGEGGPLYNA
jgi:tRNA(Arg) A34 adenosine deaminase TadA